MCRAWKFFFFILVKESGKDVTFHCKEERKKLASMTMDKEDKEQRGRLHKEGEKSATGMCLQIPVNSRLAIVKDAFSYSKSYSKRLLRVPVSPISMHISLHIEGYITTLEFGFIRYNYTDNVSGLIIFSQFCHSRKC